MSNTELWDLVFRTDPDHTKDFTRGGGFSGTAIKPLYLIHKATELWGPMGGKWGAETAEHLISDGMVFMKARLWYPADGGRALVEHWGGEQIIKFNKPNDEAFKMAFTDAIGKCLVQLGFSADIHMGEFDGNKYVKEDTKPEKKSAFTNAALRRTYCDNVIKSFDACESIKQLNEVAELNRAKFSEMDASDNEHDSLGVIELRNRFKLRLTAIREAVNYRQQQEDFKERA